jgi:hypothetical protein
MNTLCVCCHFLFCFLENNVIRTETFSALENSAKGAGERSPVSPTYILELALRYCDPTVDIEDNQKKVPQGDHDIRQALRKMGY